MTIPEMLEKVKFEGAFANTFFAKNLFLQNKKKKEQMWLVVAAHDTKIDMKAIEKHFKTGSGNLRRGDAEEMKALLGVESGAVTIFSIVNDKENKVQLVIDSRLYGEFERLGFHPMVNTHTTSITRDSLKKVVELSSHNAQVLDFATLQSDAAEAPAAKKAQPAKKEKQEEKVSHSAAQLGIETKKEDNFSKWY